MRNLAAIAFLIIAFNAIGQTTYYSRNTGSGGDWNLAASWTLSSDGTGPPAGPPGRTDDIVILNGHTITVDAANDNGSAGTSASVQYTVGGFPGNGNNKFYHTGIVDVNTGGALDITVGNGGMFGGIMRISGSLTVGDLIIAAYMEMRSGSTLSVGDDFILIDNAEVVLDNNSISADDIYMDGTSAQLCGSGDLTISGAIQEFNGADANQQICDSFTINCDDGNCCDEGTNVANCNGNGDDGSFSGSGSFTLPVELISFKAIQQESSLLLLWRTATELNNSHFTLERSFDGEAFSILVRVDGQGTTSNVTEYSFNDVNPGIGLSYYRLSQTDFDGTHTILQTVSSPGFQQNQITISPNPVTKEFVINSKEPIQIEVVDMFGRLHLKQRANSGHSINVSNWKSGIYLISWSDSSGIMGSTRLLVGD